MLDTNVNYPDSVMVVNSLDEFLTAPFTPEQNVIVYAREPLPEQIQGIRPLMEIVQGVALRRASRFGGDFLKSSTLQTDVSKATIRTPWPEIEIAVRQNRLASTAFNWVKGDQRIITDAMREIRSLRHVANRSFSLYQENMMYMNLEWDEDLADDADPNKIAHSDGCEVPTNAVDFGRAGINYSGLPTLGWAMNDVEYAECGNLISIKPGAIPFSLRLYDMWRQAIRHPEQKTTKPFIHLGQKATRSNWRMTAFSNFVF